MKYINALKISLLYYQLGLVMLITCSAPLAKSQQVSNGYVSVNGQYFNYTGDVNTSYYPVLHANAEHGGGSKSLISIGFGGTKFDMFTKISSWSRTPTKNNLDSTNFIAIGQNGNSYTPGSFMVGGKVGAGTLDPRDMLDVWGGGIHVTGADHNGTAIITSNQGTAFYGNNSYSNGLAILPNGDIGIGTASPKEKLSVNGKIRAHEIKVETSNWPDYVFKKNYHHQSIDELKAYINQRGHLPEIPSAIDAEKNGVDLGEMNKLLLKKIEELILHLINQDATIKKVIEERKMQNTRLNKQDMKIKALTQLVKSKNKK